MNWTDAAWRLPQHSTRFGSPTSKSPWIYASCLLFGSQVIFRTYVKPLLAPEDRLGSNSRPRTQTLRVKPFALQKYDAAMFEFGARATRLNTQVAYNLRTTSFSLGRRINRRDFKSFLPYTVSLWTNHSSVELNPLMKSESALVTCDAGKRRDITSLQFSGMRHCCPNSPHSRRCFPGHDHDLRSA